jgi:DNA helicase TIP49 (TBP-interacting protein)
MADAAPLTNGRPSGRGLLADGSQGEGQAPVACAVRQKFPQSSPIVRLCAGNVVTA